MLLVRTRRRSDGLAGGRASSGACRELTSTSIGMSGLPRPTGSRYGVAV